MPLSEQRKRFVDEYLIDLNGTQAAIRAGYSPKTAQEQASRLLSNVMVRAEIEKKMAERSKRIGINQDRILMELAKIALVNAGDVIDFENAKILEDAREDDLAAVASVKIKTIPGKGGKNGVEREVKLYDKLRALELAGKHLGMFKEKVEVSGGVEDEKTKLDDLLKQLRGGDPSS
ncbi:MAG: terminase small subunit [Candidatus Copromonas sp.]|jgi:phage terminase small subunit|nr:terminase small subunit [Candidatus Copromonas sp.]